MVGQLNFPFVLDTAQLTAFLTRWHTLEDEEVRLREEKRLLKEEYADDFPMRGVLTAIKRVRAARALAAHPKEPMAREHLTALETLVEVHLDHLDAERQALTEEAAGL